MYSTVLVLHSIVRWLVLIALCYGIFRSYMGFKTKPIFSKADNGIRHWTATIAHIQLILGMLVYVKSPIISYYFSDFKNLVRNWELTFFGLFHVFMMMSAIVIITIGSAKAKRELINKEKFRILLIYFSIALFLILIAIPWPFSPLATRPYLRFF